jgi:hypothetical protein
MRTPICLVLCSALGAAAADSVAQPSPDPLKSPACAQALQALETARAAGERNATESRRQEAARTCLGSPDAPARPARAAQTPMTVPPPVIQPPANQRVAPAPTPAPPPVAVGRPPVPAQCDAAGCWVNDGTHLRLIPSPSIGAGRCSTVGTQVYCP